MSKRGSGTLEYLLSLIMVGVSVLVLVPFRDSINAATTSLIFLLVVLIVAVFFGKWPAFFTSLAAALSLNFFFLPPYHTLTIAEPQNWVALIVFLVVAATVGQLSAKATERAETAETLYDELQTAFEQASEAEALRRSEKLKSALLDAVTHDIRTPLTSIKAATTMLIQEENDIHATLDREGRGDLLEVIDEETDRLNLFVDSMIEMAQLEAGVDLPRKIVDPESIVASAVQRASKLSPHNRIDVRHGTSGPISVAPKAIAEALFNLIDNAVKHSPAGGDVIVGYSSVDGAVQFFVEDRGPGIPRDKRESVFEKFVRGDNTKGSGMGLSIVKGVVEAHGGHVWLDDIPKGTKFVFEIPRNG